MIIQCILWTLAIYGFLNILINTFLRCMYKDIEVIITIQNGNCFEYIIRTLEYKLWYFKNVTYINKVEDMKVDYISDRLQEDYGVRIVKDK